MVMGLKGGGVSLGIDKIWMRSPGVKVGLW